MLSLSTSLPSPDHTPSHSPALTLSLPQFYLRMKDTDITEQFLWDTRLSPLLSYLTQDQIRRVREALSLAFDAHQSQRRKSGEPFITHPVEVTRILAELQMDYESLVAGLLHDTVEDCGETVGLEEIGFHFGPAVQRIVEGETKFSKLPTHHPERQQQAASVESSVGSANEPAASTSTAVASVVEPTKTRTTTTSTSGEVLVEDADTLQQQQQSDAKAQDLQFLFLAMTEEVRIIIVKLADRLHNMRTMASMPPGKQRRIAQETLSVFAPLARLLGLYTIKEELEELSFMYAMPQQYAVMRKQVDRLWEQQTPAVEVAAVELRRFIKEDSFLNARLRGVRVEVTKKALYSAWRKLQESAKTVRDVSEIAQLRVVVETAPQDGGVFDRPLCYHIMGLIHSHWAPVPGTMKDYIATPKPNNYQSLHTTVLPTGLAAVPRGKGAPSLFPIEVQIRTLQMERLAQYGIAVESWSCADYARSISTNGSVVYSASGSSTDSTDMMMATSTNRGTSGSSNGTSSTSSSNGMDKQRKNGSMPLPLGALSWLRLGALLSGVGGTGSTASAGSEEDEAEDTFLVSDDGGYSEGDDLQGLEGQQQHSGSNGNGNGAVYENGASSNGAVKYTNGSSNGATRNGTYSSSTTDTTTANQSGIRLDPQTMSRRINWLNSIRQWQEEFVGTLTAQEFVACVTDDLLGQGVFVFTPSGQVMRLPKGSTVVDFAYHIHTDVGNTMVTAKVNGKIVAADHELANAEVVEVITYKGPPNPTVIKRHQRWLACAKTKTARIKLAKFLREHAALAASVGLLAPGDSALGAAQRGGGPGSAAGASTGADQVVWLIISCDDRQGLLAEIANVISRHNHNIRSYSGSTDRDAALFVMEYELEGPPEALGSLCEDMSTVESVLGWQVGCALPSARAK